MFSLFTRLVVALESIAKSLADQRQSYKLDFSKGPYLLDLGLDDGEDFSMTIHRPRKPSPGDAEAIRAGFTTAERVCKSRGGDEFDKIRKPINE